MCMYTNTLKSVRLRSTLEVTHITFVQCHIIVVSAVLAAPHVGSIVGWVGVRSGLQLDCCSCMGGDELEERVIT